jgi:hypothetical protein
MANIFKTTLKKDIIADIANNNVREIRFPITKFWATRFADEFDLDKKEFTFKTFDSLELSSPSNKDTGAMTYMFDFERTYVDGEEFVVVFKMSDEDVVDSCPKEAEVEVENVVTEVLTELHEIPTVENDVDGSDVEFGDDEYETPDITNTDVFTLIKDWFDDERVLENFYEDENVFATNARQVIILPKGRILGSKRILPVNNDVEVRVEFDMNKRIYFDSIPDFDIFEEEVLRMLSEVKKNNFVFVWRRNTGIFMDNDGRVYFGIKYSTRKSIGFNRRYNVQ